MITSLRSWKQSGGGRVEGGNISQSTPANHNHTNNNDDDNNNDDKSVRLKDINSLT